MTMTIDTSVMMARKTSSGGRTSPSAFPARDRPPGGFAFHFPFSEPEPSFSVRDGHRRFFLSVIRAHHHLPSSTRLLRILFLAFSCVGLSPAPCAILDRLVELLLV